MLAKFLPWKWPSATSFVLVDILSKSGRVSCYRRLNLSLNEGQV